MQKNDDVQFTVSVAYKQTTKSIPMKMPERSTYSLLIDKLDLRKYGPAIIAAGKKITNFEKTLQGLKKRDKVFIILQEVDGLEVPAVMTRKKKKKKQPRPAWRLQKTDSERSDYSSYGNSADFSNYHFEFKLGDLVESQILSGKNKGEWLVCKITRLNQNPPSYDIDVLNFQEFGVKPSAVAVAPRHLRKSRSGIGNQGVEEKSDFDPRSSKLKVRKKFSGKTKKYRDDVGDDMDDELPPVRLTLQARKSYVNVFRSIDSTGEGCINKEDLIKLFVTKGQEIPPDIDDIFKELDLTSEGKVTLAAFLEMMRKHQEQKEREVRKSFQSFDTNGNGILSPKEIQDGFFKFGRKVTDEEVDLMIKAADTTGNGKINFQEFKTIMGAV